MDDRPERETAPDHGVPMTTREGVCAVPGCGCPVLARELCGRHYRERRALMAPPCKRSLCGRPAVCKGLCPRHYEQDRRRRKAREEAGS